MTNKILFLSIVLVSFITCSVEAQMATKVSSSYNYGKLFSDGTTLYEVKADTLFSVSTSTGTHTFISKLPAPPEPDNFVKWGLNILVKTSAGFMIDQQIQRLSNPGLALFRVWANTGNGWDTIATTSTAYASIGQLMKLGSKWAFYVGEPSNLALGSHIVRTDFTRSGSSIVRFPTGTYAADLNQGNDRVFFSMIGNGSNTTGKVVMLDDNALTVIDSAVPLCKVIAAVGNDLVYYREQITTTTVQTVDYTVRKWTNATGVVSNLVASVPAGTEFSDGATLKGNVIVQKRDTGRSPQRQNLVSINPVTGAQTYLTANTFNDSNFPIYEMQLSGFGSDHAYVLTRDSVGYVTTITDGATAAGTHKLGQPGIAFIHPKSNNPDLGALCGDDEYGQPIATTGISPQLYHISPSGVISHQDLNATTISGSLPNSFVHVGGEIYFTASQEQGTTGFLSYVYDLWKISGCGVASSVSTLPGQYTSESMVLYPNPASDRVSVAQGAGVNGAILDIIDATGRTVMHAPTSSVQSFSTAALPSGLYFFRIIVNGTPVHSGRLSILH